MHLNVLQDGLTAKVIFFVVLVDRLYVNGEGYEVLGHFILFMFYRHILLLGKNNKEFRNRPFNLRIVFLLGFGLSDFHEYFR